MAQRCIFCGKELGFFNRDDTLCGGVTQPTCSECYKTLRDLGQKERGERALATGRAVDPEEIIANIQREEQKEQAAQERKERARQVLRTGQTCLRCGGPMEKYGTKLFHLGDEGLLGPVARDGLFASWLEAEVIRCAHCGRAEFYLPEPPEIPSEPAEEQVTCPVCGTEHSSLSGCPTCALNRARGGRRTDAKNEKGQKPPWEK